MTIGLRKANSCAAAVLFDEYDTGGFKGFADTVKSFRTWNAKTLFEIDNSSAGNACGVRNFGLFKAQKGAGCFALGRRHHSKSYLKSDCKSDTM